MNVPDSWLTKASVVFNCKLSHIPFVYLGLPIGGDHNRLDFWQLLVDRNKKKLSGWKSTYLSLGFHFILLKCLIIDLGLLLSFFKARSIIISSIESI